MLKVLCCLFCFVVSGSSFLAQNIKIDVIESTIGAKGKWTKDVFKVSAPRPNLGVTVRGVSFPAPMGLTSWAAFKSTGDGKVMVMGDLTLLSEEVNPVMSAILEGGMGVTALHNHLLWDEPRIMYMHITGHDTEENLATTLKKALALMKNPPAAPSQPAGNATLDTKAIEKILGHSGEQSGEVFKVTIGRPDVTVKMHGVEVDSTMGVNTWAAFRPTSQGAAVDGDFVMLANEVSPVLKTLREHDIQIVAIHNHMVGEEPTTYFLHYWSEGPVDKLATGLRAALAHLGKRR